MVVVLPVPFTPTTRITCGLRLRSSTSGLATGARMAAISSASASLTSASVTLRPNLLRRKLATMSAAAAGPRSAPSSSSSSSASAASSSVRLTNAALRPPVSFSVRAGEPGLQLAEETAERHQAASACRPPRIGRDHPRPHQRARRAPEGGRGEMLGVAAPAALGQHGDGAAELARRGTPAASPPPSARSRPPAPAAAPAAPPACGRRACRGARCRGRRAGRGSPPPPRSAPSRRPARPSRSGSRRSGRRRSRARAQAARAGDHASAAARLWRRRMRLSTRSEPDCSDRCRCGIRRGSSASRRHSAASMPPGRARTAAAAAAPAPRAAPRRPRRRCRRRGWRCRRRSAPPPARRGRPGADLRHDRPPGTLRLGPRPNGMVQKVQRWSQPGLHLHEAAGVARRTPVRRVRAPARPPG